VIKRIAPEVEVIDITHGIPPQHVLQGALVLANTVPYMPAGVHVAIVDPGVGGERKPLALRGEDGRVYVGPDNGLLVVAAERLGGIAEAVEIAEAAYMLERVSYTFHGRDIFSPAAAHLANGVQLMKLGPALDPAGLRRLEVPEPAVGEARIRATVLYVDRFGNVALNLKRDDLEDVELAPGTRLSVKLPSGLHEAVFARTFVDARAGDLILYEDSYRKIALAVSRGDASQLLRVRPGDELVVDRLRREL
jgi:hypothetical protein